MRNKLFVFIVAFLLFSCKEESVPKPHAYLSLEFEKQQYARYDQSPYFDFEKNKEATFEALNNGWAKIHYPKLKASIDITYRPVKNNLKSLLMESEKLTFSHVIKADGISSQEFENSKNHTYGRIYEVTGDAATNLQFNLTDSLKNFITASVYFKVQPNFDSIEPAVDYLKEDIKVLMESLTWKK